MTTTDSSNEPVKEKAGDNFRFSVVMPVSEHLKLVDYVRERAYATKTPYTKSDFVREAILSTLNAEQKTDEAPLSTDKKVEDNFRFSVVMPVLEHLKLVDYVRERAYKTKTAYTKSDFVREAVLSTLKKAEQDLKDKKAH